MSAPPTGKLVRGAVGGMALAKAGIAHISHQARKLTTASAGHEAAQERLDDDLGRILFGALNQLKGTALKLSQLLSAHADFLPEKIRNQLAKGCYQVTPLNRALVHKVFRQEFGQPADLLFAHFDAQAFAAASLGQVHRARLADGSEVAVKVQYPGIASSINSDLQIVRAVMHTLGKGSNLLPRKELLDQVMDEIAGKLREELDYEHEAAQLTWFRAHVTMPGIAIPLPIASHSSKRVLTMTRLDGLHIDQWLATNPDQASRDRYGQLLFDWFWYSLFELGRLHADPHAGNFLFMPDGRLGLLDFGLTRSMSVEFCAGLTRAWHARLHLPSDAANVEMRLAYIDLGVISDSLSQQDFDQQLMPAIAPMIDWQLEPLRAERCDFARRTSMPHPDASAATTVNALMTGMHRDALYFNRSYIGVLQMLKQIGATVTTANSMMFFN
jgi:predicted unusual protein kinase regulating ubiquinone biosynthesis (AarF/ABC1/UbiB family)